MFLSTTVSKHIFYSVCCCIYSRYIIISLGYLISTHKEHNKTFRNWKARSCLCSDLILNAQFRLFNQTNPIILFFFLYRSVISYKTDEKPIYSFETVAGSGK